jgi:hypothetical protein
LITLRILGRGNCADDIAEFSGFSANTINFIFHEMTERFVEAFYDEFISFPTGDELEKVQQSYADMGFPGACGSMDATHVRLSKCPHGLRVLATGKEHYPTLAFQAVCAPNRKILYCSVPFLGSYNDITITANDSLCSDISGGLLDNLRYKVVGEGGVPSWVSGGYLIVDGGYSTASWLMEPFGSGCSVEEKRWSEWLESVRKDIECTFGILKSRFRLFDMPLRFHYFKDIHNAWKMCLILHNMLITYDGNDLSDWEKNVNWSYIDPVFDTLDGEDTPADDSVVMMNDYVESDIVRTRGHRAPPRAPVRVEFDNTPDGDRFVAGNVFHYYEKRKQLVSHFNFLFKLGLVKWPRRSGVGVRLCMRIPRVDMRNTDRTRGALYVRKSDFLLKDVEAHIDPRIGEGLFSHYGYCRGDIVAKFVGVVMAREDYDEDARSNNTGGYCRLKVSNADVVTLVCDREYIAPHVELAYNYGAEFQYPPPLPL